MRHGKKFNHLGRVASHRKAMLSNLAKSLILHKRITTTVAKAKALRKFVEPIITKSKQDTTHARRVVFSYFQDKEPVKELFNQISDKIADRPGGYTRIIRIGNRLGDNAAVCIIELVDYNAYLIKEYKPKKSKTRRSRRGSKEQNATSAQASLTSSQEDTANAKEITAEKTKTSATDTEKKVDQEKNIPQKENASSAGEKDEKDNQDA